MKKFLLVLSLFLVGCTSVSAPEKVDSSTKKAQPSKEEEKIKYQDVSEVKDVVVMADSALVDDTNIGFNYEAGMVLDQDFSTAWCTAKGGKGGELVMDFADYVQADKVGILPGFGRDESIYSKNNRIKSLGVTFDENEEQIFDFDDSYRMHFVDLNDAKFKKIKFAVKDVYKGSKYNDTCISEVDFWSDFLENEDSQAAMNYYVKYKKDFATRPYDIIDKISLSDVPFDKCSKPVASKGDYMSLDKNNDEYVLDPVFYGRPVYISAAVNEYGLENEDVEMKIYYSYIVIERELLESKGYFADVFSWFLADSGNARVVKSCDGKLYVNYSFSPKLGGDYYPANYRIEFLKNNKVIGKTSFSIIE